MTKNLVPYSVLRIGDRVNLFPESMIEFGTAVVKNIRDGQIYFYRPYVITQSFISTGGVICSVSVEEFNVSVNQGGTVELIRWEDPEKLRKFQKDLKQRIQKELLAGQTAKAMRLLNEL